MDTKPLQKQAENHISSELLKYDFKLTEPSFDKDGTDLIIVENISSKNTKLIKIQCKGRGIKNGSSNIKIPVSYVEENFVVFLYVIDKNKINSLFLFFPDQIKKWSINNKNEHVLNISERKILQSDFQDQLFNKKLSEKLRNLLQKTEIKNYTSLFVDGIFLEKAMDKTLKTYSKIWPKKRFIKPDLITVLKNILESYDRHKSEKKIVNCYIFLSESFDLKARVKLTDTSNFKTKNGNEAKIFINTTNEIIAFEILEQVNRLINNDNIILVANDIIYEHEIDNLAEKKVDLIIVKFNNHDDHDMISKLRWGDITYPLGFSIGLERHEL